MTPLELARQYMDIVFTTGNYSDLRQICCDDLKFRGPWYHYETADDYIHALLADPPDDFQYKLIKSYQDSSSACLVYEFSKQEICTIMVQTFEIEDDKISNILLVFDTSAFK